MKRTRYKHSRSAGCEVPLPYEEPAASQDESKTRLNKFASGGKWMNDLPVPKAVCLSLLGLLAASSPLSGFTGPFPFAAFLAGVWLQNAKGEHPLEPAQGFTLPWMDRSLAQCGSMRRHAPNFHNTPPSGRCTPRYVLRGYQIQL